MFDVVITIRGAIRAPDRWTAREQAMEIVEALWDRVHETDLSTADLSYEVTGMGEEE